MENHPYIKAVSTIMKRNDDLTFMLAFIHNLMTERDAIHKFDALHYLTQTLNMVAEFEDCSVEEAANLLLPTMLNNNLKAFYVSPDTFPQISKFLGKTFHIDNYDEMEEKETAIMLEFIKLGVGKHHIATFKTVLGGIVTVLISGIKRIS